MPEVPRDLPKEIAHYKDNTRFNEYKQSDFDAYNGVLLQCLRLANPNGPWRVADISANSAAQVVNFAETADANNPDVTGEYYIFDAMYQVSKKETELYKSAIQLAQNAHVSPRTTIHAPQSRYAQQLSLADLGGQPANLLVDLKGALWYEVYMKGRKPVDLLRHLVGLASPQGGILIDGNEQEEVSTYGVYRVKRGIDGMAQDLQSVGLTSHPFTIGTDYFTFLQRT